MKKKRSIIMFAVMFISGVFMTTNKNFAATITNERESDIQFVSDDNQELTPVDPGPKPPEPIEPGPNPPAPGALRFDHVPSLKFGNNNRIEAQSQNYYALFEQVTTVGETVSHEANNFLQVTDARGGTLGWKVNVSNDGIFKSPGVSDIKNTHMTFNDFTVKTLSNITDFDKTPTLTQSEVVIGKDQGVQELVKADGAKQQGYGSWHVVIGDVLKRTSGQGYDGTGTTGKVDETKKDRNPAIQLHVPAGEIIYKDKLYTTTVIWELSDKL